MKRIFAIAAFVATIFSVNAQESLKQKYEHQMTTPRFYDCFRTDSKIKIDGKLNEGDWGKAPASEPFVDISGYHMPKPVKETWVKMMWDKENLYIGAQLLEDNIVARLTQRDTIIYKDNDFEVFIDPDGDGQHYFEFENNARGVLFDLMLDKPYRSGGSFFIPWNCEGVQIAVSHDGTLNNPKDKDRAWYVEMAIPFKALKRDFKDPRDFKVWRINFSRVQWLVPGKPEENWVWTPTGRVDMHMPERWGFLRFVDARVGTRAVAEDLNIDLEAYKFIWGLFYSQLDFKGRTQEYHRTIADFNLTPEDMSMLPTGSSVGIEATSKAFDIEVSIPARNEVYHLNQNGRFEITPFRK